NAGSRAVDAKRNSSSSEFRNRCRGVISAPGVDSLSGAHVARRSANRRAAGHSAGRRVLFSTGGRFMPEVQIRKRVVMVEEILHEGVPMASTPQRRAAALAVIHNPYAGRYEERIEGFMHDLQPLGMEMARSLVKALGGDPKAVEGYGKGAIVGAAGELEHGALWHVPGGYAMREVLGNAKAIVASTKKVGGPGARLDIPVTHINASYVRSHFD